MLNENFLIRSSLIFSIVGILILFLVSRTIELSDTSIEKLGLKKIDEDVKLRGFVKSVRHSGQTTFVVISETADVDAVIFDSINLSVGDTVEIIGKISEYDGKRNIVVDSLSRVKS